MRAIGGGRGEGGDPAGIVRFFELLVKFFSIRTK